MSLARLGIGSRAAQMTNAQVDLRLYVKADSTYNFM